MKLLNLRRFNIVLIVSIILNLTVVPLLMVRSAQADTEQPLFYDGAELLSRDKAEKLNGELAELRARYNFNVVVATEMELPSKYNGDAQGAADDYYDQYFGMDDPGDDGILLILFMDTRDWRIVTEGSGVQVFTDNRQASMMDDNVLPYLGDGDYYEAFTRFVEMSADFLAQGPPRNTARQSAAPNYPSEYGNDYDYNEPSYKYTLRSMTTPQRLLVAGGGGLVLAGVVMVFLARQLRSVKPNHLANNYIKDGSFMLTQQRDVFLRRSVARHAKPKNENNGSGGGSSTHRSSSGHTHGGSGGKF